MSLSPFAVRQLQTPAEMQAYYSLAAHAFAQNEEPEAAAAHWYDYTTHAPDHDPRHLRGVFLDDALVGGYTLFERRLNLRGAWLDTGCISALVTDPGYRLRGVGRLMLRDADERAQQLRLALLLLDGVANFYARFGYADCLDLVEHAVRRADVLALAPSPYAVRPATLEDAPALYALHHAHFDLRAGGFDRGPEMLRYALGRRPPNTGPWLALDGQGRARGYLYAARPPRHWRALEVAVDDWHAALALLQFQARWFDDADPSQVELAWHAPLDSPACFYLADHLRSTAPSTEDGTLGWTARSTLYARPDSDWLARPACLAALFEALLPACLARGQAWPASLLFSVDGEEHLLALAPGSAVRERVALSSQSFTALLFGYRPVAWAQAQPGQDIPAQAVPLLEALFPWQPAFVAATDAF